MLGSADTARRGNLVSAVGMLLAVVATLLYNGDGLSYSWILVGLIVGGLIGAVAARRVKMTAHAGNGGACSTASAAWPACWWAGRSIAQPAGHGSSSVARAHRSLAVLIGGVTFTGSMIAYGKLAEKIAGKPDPVPRAEDRQPGLAAGRPGPASGSFSRRPEASGHGLLRAHRRCRWSSACWR